VGNNSNPTSQFEPKMQQHTMAISTNSPKVGNNSNPTSQFEPKMQQHTMAISTNSHKKWAS
jgi:hypothetical protein